MEGRVVVVDQSAAVNQAYDLLGPGGAALGKTGDKHVIVSRCPVLVYKFKSLRIHRCHQHIPPAVVVDRTYDS
jgi:hypothetical protein